jgi:hypothetical protein
MQKDQTWKRFLTPLRFTITLGLLIYLVWQADPLQIWQKLQTVHLSWLLLAILLQFGGVALSSYKWRIILSARDQQQPYKWLLNTYLAGQFANNFLPTGVGGDAVRAVQLGRKIGSYSQSSASIFVDRLTGFLALSLIANVALVMTYSGFAGFHLTAANPADHEFLNDTILFLITIGFTLAGIAAVGGCFGAPWFSNTFGKHLPDFIRSPVERIAQSLSDYFPKGRTLLQVLVLSFLFQSLWIVINFVCGQALNIDAPILIYALIAPITDILGLLPIFVNNMGARELVFTFFLFYVGVPKATALALAFLILFVRLIVSAFGGLVVMTGGASLRVTPVPKAKTLSGKSG